MHLLKQVFKSERNKAELAEAVAATANAVIKERDERIAALEAENRNLRMELGYGQKNR